MFDPSLPTAAPMVWGVAALLQAASDALAARLGAVAVRGEISTFSRAPSGHCYLALKDADGAAALLRCAMFRRAATLLDFEPREGMQVELRGRVGLYEPRGELQLIVESMSRLGAGGLYEQFLRLRERLAREGLFEPARKRALPPVPHRLAVVTSPAAAAWQDVMASLRRRAPHVEVVLIASPVQGNDAPPALADAIGRAGRIPMVDLVMVARGGGSIEDLWAFNDERVVRAIASCPTPVVTGIGHESDVTLADLAADMRAATPTAAAELATPALDDLIASLDLRSRGLADAARRQLERHQQRLDLNGLRLGPASRTVSAQIQRLDGLLQRWTAAVRAQVPLRRPDLDARHERLGRLARASVERAQARLEALGERLRSVDPRTVLARGYAWVQDDAGCPLTSVSKVAPGQRVTAVWADGEARARIESTRLDPMGGSPGTGTSEFPMPAVRDANAT